MKGVKVKFKRPSKLQYIKEIISFCFSFRGIKYWVSLWSYIIVNMGIGRKKANIGKNTKIHPTVLLRQAERISIGTNCLINHNNVLQAGKKSGRIIIGNCVHTGANVMIFAFNHSIDDIETPSILQDYYDDDVKIEDDLWIGAGSVIVAGVKIGKGAVIGSNSVVTKNIPPYSIVGGVPAKIIRTRK